MLADRAKAMQRVCFGAEPSESDRLITRRLKDALALVDVRVLDHVVVGGGYTVSMAEQGVL